MSVIVIVYLGKLWRVRDGLARLTIFLTFWEKTQEIWLCLPDRFSPGGTHGLGMRLFTTSASGGHYMGLTWVATPIVGILISSQALQGPLCFDVTQCQYLPCGTRNHTITNTYDTKLCENLGVWLRLVVMKNSLFVHQQVTLREETTTLQEIEIRCAIDHSFQGACLELTVSGRSKQTSKHTLTCAIQFH